MMVTTSFTSLAVNKAYDAVFTLYLPVHSIIYTPVGIEPQTCLVKSQPFTTEPS